MCSDTIHIVANPISGHGKGKVIATKLNEHLEANLHWTENGPQCEALSRKLASPDATIVACGGDGTVHGVVNGIANTKATLAVMAAGRGNDLARMLDLPTDPEQMAEVIKRHNTRSIDLARATQADGTQRIFSTVACCGFDAEVARRIAAGSPIGGPWAYTYGVLRTLITYRPREATIRGDFGEHTGPIYLAATAKTSMYGGGVKIAPGASLDDGLLRLCIVRPVSRPTVIALFGKVRAGKHLDHPAVDYHATSKVEITSPDPLDLYADGEPLATTPVTMDVLPRAMEVVVP
jgi:diacylglycerol kinase (ATP)